MFLKIYSRAISLKYLSDTISCKFDIFFGGGGYWVLELVINTPSVLIAYT